jgi:ribosome-associated toxin RatA of RatAB toxin-antitoxin module
MYRLVHDVGAYPKFLSWCRGTTILEQTEIQQIASLKVAFGGLQQEFTTRNTLEQDAKVSMSMVDGPFSHLQGEWKFEKLGDKGCKILLYMDFNFQHSLLSLAFERGFSKVADRLVKDFCLRADEIYG